MFFRRLADSPAAAAVTMLAGALVVALAGFAAPPAALAQASTANKANDPQASAASAAASSAAGSGAAVPENTDGAHSVAAPVGDVSANATTPAPGGNGYSGSAITAGPAGLISVRDVSPQVAQRALGVLQDSEQRTAAVHTLQAIAAAAPVASAGQASPAAQPTVVAVTPAASAAPVAKAAPASAAAPAASAPAAASSTNAPLQANGLIAQLLHLIARWAGGLADQVHKLAQAVVALPAFAKWLVQVFSTQRGMAIGLQALEALAALFVAGLAAEFALRYALRRPRAALVHHADTADHEARAREIEEEKAVRRRKAEEAKEEAKERAATEAAAAAAAAGETAAIDGDGGLAADSARTTPATASAAVATGSAADPQSTGAAAGGPGKTAAERAAGAASGSVALVRTVVDGEERVEAVAVDAGDGVSLQNDSADMSPEAQAAADQLRKHQAGEAEKARLAERAKAAAHGLEESVKHWRTLRHAPFALGVLILDWLPFVLFFFIAGLALRWVDVDNGRVDNMAEAFIDAYLTARVTMSIIRLLVAPAGRGVRLVDVRPATATSVMRGFGAMVTVGALGVALVNGGAAFGASQQGQMAFMKLVSLIVHACAVLLIFRTRHATSATIAGRPDATGPTAGIRRWLADIWPFFATFVVIAVWVVWALGVEDGFPKLLHFTAVSAAVIIGARLLAIVLLGGVGRAFRHSAHEDDDGSERSASSRLADRYYPIVRGIVSALIWVSALITLLQVWGFSAVGWFTNGGVGRNLASAALTIAVAAVVAVVVWESANLGVDRRLKRWIEHGDTVRAARLRTLLPMMRTGLFICIALIVGLTALNEIGVNTTPLLAGASIIGVALGFGSQKLVQDFITGIFLLMENAMQVGDYVTVAGISGSVEYLSIRTVRLRGSDGSLYIVPFSSVTTVNNINRGLGNAAVRVSVAYDTDVNVVIAELKQLGAAMRQDPTYSDKILADLEIWGVDSVDGAMVTVAGQFRCLDSGRWGVQREFNKRIFERFKEAGIEIANPRINWAVAGSSGSAPTVPGNQAADPNSSDQPK